MLHPQFRLHGKAYNRASLLKAAKQWASTAEGEQRELGAFLIEWLSATPTITLQTSGSTEKPKRITTTKTAMCISAQRTGTYFSLSAGNRALLCLPLQYIAGKMMLVRAMVLGLELDMIPPKTDINIGDQTYDFAALIPLQASSAFTQLGQVKTVLIGGAPIPYELQKSIAKEHPHCIETYGMTETLTHIATRPIRYPAVPFRVMPDVKIATNNKKCLVLQVPYISASPIVTNDLVELVDPQSFVLLGRRDWVINTGGKKIFPEQLEEKLDPFMKVPFFFTGISDEVFGEKLVLVAEADATEKETITKTVAQVLGADKHHMPKEVICVKAFTYTPSGKLNRKKTISSFLS